jgi:Mg/Co/Ni transporter MgtE
VAKPFRHFAGLAFMRGRRHQSARVRWRALAAGTGTMSDKRQAVTGEALAAHILNVVMMMVFGLAGVGAGAMLMNRFMRSQDHAGQWGLLLGAAGAAFAGLALIGWSVKNLKRGPGKAERDAP